MPYKYVPILKSKPAEIWTWQNASVFPTYVGVDRYGEGKRMNCLGIPHVCGDGPPGPCGARVLQCPLY